MDQMPGGMQGGMGAEGAGAATTPQGGAATTSGDQWGAQSQSSAGGGNPWDTDDRFRGKSAADVWKSYGELQKKMGSVGEMEKALQQWQQFGSAWTPYLESVGYDPQRLAAALEAAARARQAGASPQQQQQAAQRAAWGDAITPEQQEKWLGNQFSAYERRSQQNMQKVATALVDYVNRFGDLAVRAIEKKFAQLPEAVRPKIEINDLLQEAVNIANNRYDPLEWAAKIRTAESPEAMEARIRADERAKAEAELKNRQLTTFSGAGTGNPRTLRPRSNGAPAQTGMPAARTPEAQSMASARDRFVNKWSDIAPS